MEIKPIVTANVWNLCQNSCKYCVSHSPDPSYDSSRDYSEVLDVHALIRWIKKYRPDAKVNVSGGEPLFFPQIEDWVYALLSAGLEVTILTNGQSLPHRKRLHDAPVNWIITYHLDCGVPMDVWARGLSPLNGRDGVKIQCVLVWDDGDLRRMHDLQQYLDGFYLCHRWVDNDRRTADEQKIQKVVPPENLASYWATLVENDGYVYACNTKLGGPVGSIYDMTFDLDKAKLRDARSAECLAGQWCGAVLALCDDFEKINKHTGFEYFKNGNFKCK